MMKRLALAISLLLIPVAASAQCNGVFQPGYYCGNGGAAAAPPTAVPLSLVAVTPIQTTTATSKTFGAADLNKETRRSNGGSAMTDTFPASTASGLGPGTKIIVTNFDATASDTITAGSGTAFSGGSTDVVSPGRSIQYVYDTTGSPIWRRTLNTGTALLAPNNLSDLLNAATARINLGVGSAALVTTIASLQAQVALSAGDARYLTLSGRAGKFVWSAANLSALVTADAQKCVYVPPATDTTGASGAWVRVTVNGYITPQYCGAVGDNSTDDTTAVGGFFTMLQNGFAGLFTNTYAVNSGFTATSAIRLYGLGNATGLSNKNAALNAPILRITSAGANNSHLEKFSVLSVAGIGSGTYGVEIDGGQQWIAKELNISGTYIGFNVPLGTAGANIDALFVTGTVSHGIAIDAGNLTLTNSFVVNAGGDGYRFTSITASSGGLNVRGNTAYNSAGKNFDFLGNVTHPITDVVASNNISSVSPNDNGFYFDTHGKNIVLSDLYAEEAGMNGSLAVVTTGVVGIFVSANNGTVSLSNSQTTFSTGSGVDFESGTFTLTGGRYQANCQSGGAQCAGVLVGVGGSVSGFTIVGVNTEVQSGSTDSQPFGFNSFTFGSSGVVVGNSWHGTSAASQNVGGTVSMFGNIENGTFVQIVTAQIANNAITLAKLATQATNTTLGNATSGTAVPTALGMPSCDTATKALQWTTNTGYVCNSAITAASMPTTGLTGTLQAAQEPAHTGDVTNSAGSLALALATVNSNVGTFGSATQVPQITVNGKGLITAVTNVTITRASLDLPLAGGTMGAVTITPTGNQLNFTNPSITSADTIAAFLAANLTNGQRMAYFLGRSLTSGDSAYVGFTPNATASLAQLNFGFNGFNNLLNVIANGGVTMPGLSNTATTSALCFNPGTGLLSYDGTIGTCTVSDERLKNMGPRIDHALDKLLQLNGVYGTWKNPAMGDGRQVFIGAQTAEKVFPELVSTDATGTKSLDYQRLTAPIIEALREIKADNDNLRACNDNWKCRIFGLKVAR